MNENLNKIREELKSCMNNYDIAINELINSPNSDEAKNKIINVNTKYHSLYKKLSEYLERE